MSLIRICVGLWTIWSAASIAYASESTTALLLEGARIVDPATGKVLTDHAVLIVDDRIANVAPRSEITPPPHAVRLDLAGLTLVPGLIDLHSHLLLHPYDEASWNDQVLKESLELRTIRAVVAARKTVQAGFTTIRDLGTEGAAFADVALRDAIADGMIPGPRVFAVTRAIVATGCYGPSGFDPRWQLPKGAQVADGAAGVRRVVREQIAAGADWIKVYADYRRQTGGPATPTFSQDELDAIVAESRSAGLPVAAHATTAEAIRRAVLAGVSTIEHGTDATDEVLALMRERGVALCPTLAASEAMARYGGWRPSDPDHPRLIAAKAMFARAMRSGVTIACGSDVGVFSHGDSVRELELMAEFGMSPGDVLRSATTVAAGVLGRANDLGRIAEGYLADIIAVKGMPLKDVSTLRGPVLVIKGGEVMVDHRGDR